MSGLFLLSPEALAKGGFVPRSLSEITEAFFNFCSLGVRDSIGDAEGGFTLRSLGEGGSLFPEALGEGESLSPEALAKGNLYPPKSF